MRPELPFWRRKSLDELTPREWESLCDGCGRCCLNKIEDEQSKDLFFTNVACRLLDPETCRCTNYRRRFELVSDCTGLTVNRPEDFEQLPVTCAYRRLAEGKGLAWWHPLISGRAESVDEAGVSVRGKTISEEHVHSRDLEQYIVDWFD